MTPTPRYSVIVPVYNRPDEVRDLLDSLLAQTCRDFEVIIVEDGSTVPCKEQCDDARARGLDVHYHFKDNEGRSIARNHGIGRSRGQWLVFFDSDCVIPPGYFRTLTAILDANPGWDCYGGPDAAHASFTPVQKAINFAMTSFLTTGGIRGGKRSMEKFTPRTFNMGYTRRVYDTVGGFREMFSEDIDMSTRISRAGFVTGLAADAPVWHKRRVDLAKFFRQVHVFGMSRITLQLLYPGSLKVVHMLPALAVVAFAALLVLAVAVSWWWLLPVGIYVAALLALAAWQTRSLKVTLLAVPAAAIQLTGYGTGFIRAFTDKMILGHKRNVNDEIAIRKGR